MATIPVLTPEEVREYIHDFAANNHLLNGVEFSDTSIRLCMDFAIDRFNQLPPKGLVDQGTFPSKSILLYGTLWQMFTGQSALMARNTFSYTDGGLQIPVEERFQFYDQLAGRMQQEFMSAAQALKREANIEDGWGCVTSDYRNFPIW